MPPCCEKQLIQSLQVVQNRAARFVTKCGLRTPVAELLKQCGWLSVRQQIFFHSVILIHKTLQTKQPGYLYEKIRYEFPIDTRLARSNQIRLGPQYKARLDLTKDSLRWRGVESYNLVPTSIKQGPTIKAFKGKLKSWIKSTIDL